MSFPRYEAYKDSGVEWLGDVPMHWEILPAKRRFRRKKDLNQGMACENRLALTMSGVIPRDLADLEGLQASEFETYQIFQPQDLVFKLIDLQNFKTSRVGLVPDTGIMSPAYIRLEPDKTKVEPQFAYWYFTDLYNRHIFNQLGGGVRQTLGPEELLYLPFPAFSLLEQSSISSFLDRETSKIDALVSEQRRLVELLKEKRQAVISHAVTKGLDPTVKMKHSGIDWIGDIPHHWTTPPVYARYEQVLGKMLDQKKISGEYPTPYLRNLDVRWDYVNVNNLPIMDIRPDEIERFTVRKGDLLMVEGRELGRSAIWNGEDNCIAFQKALHRLRHHDSSEYVRYFYYLMAFANSTGIFLANQLPNEIPHLTGESLRKHRFPKPPIDEQIEITEVLDCQSQKIESLIAEANRSITLLQERRTALISAAVTGKIDVRGIALEGARP